MLTTILPTIQDLEHVSLWVLLAMAVALALGFVWAVVDAMIEPFATTVPTDDELQRRQREQPVLHLTARDAADDARVALARHSRSLTLARKSGAR